MQWGIKMSKGVIEKDTISGLESLEASDEAVNAIKEVDNVFAPKETKACLDCGEAQAASTEQTSSSPAQEAKKHIGSEDWAYKADRPPYGEDINKCNLFVYEMLNDSGKPVAMKERFSISNLEYVKYPPLAGQWADKSEDIPGWKVVTSPQPGDVAAIPGNYSDASGHVGIVSGSNTTISATANKVVESDWGFRDGQKPTFRRYVDSESGASSEQNHQ